VEDIEGIASVVGVDGIFIGPADLSVDYGYNHQTSEEFLPRSSVVRLRPKPTEKPT
jgi:2-keto-3-deoxy-L-rhamnonate aldolase RhmA